MASIWEPAGTATNETVLRLLASAYRMPGGEQELVHERVVRVGLQLAAAPAPPRHGGSRCGPRR
ncbi:MAG: hypothetical protein ACLP8S_10340 [Solirubrobacteraceae bacterium]